MVKNSIKVYARVKKEKRNTALAVCMLNTFILFASKPNFQQYEIIRREQFENLQIEHRNNLKVSSDWKNFRKVYVQI